MGNCCSSLNISDEFIIDVLVRILQCEQRMRSALQTWLSEGATMPLNPQLLEDVAWWTGTRFAVADLLGKGGPETRMEKLMQDLKTLDFGTLPRESLMAVLQGIDEDRFIPEISELAGQFETSIAVCSIYESGLADWLQNKKNELDRRVDDEKHALPEGQERLEQLKMEREFYKKACSSASNMFVQSALQATQFSRKSFQFEIYGLDRLSQFQPIPKLLVLQVYAEALKNLKAASNDAPMALVWRALVQSLDLTQPLALADADYRKLWANPPWGAVLRALSEKVLVDKSPDTFNFKHPIVYRVNVIWDAIRGQGVQIMGHYNFLQQVLQSQKQEALKPKEWSTEDKERLRAYFGARDDQFLSWMVTPSETVKQRILTILA